MKTATAPSRAGAGRAAAGIPVGIAGIAGYVPERVVPNEYFTQFVETSDEWIQQRTGILERRWLNPEQRPSDMFVAAGGQALQRAGVKPEDVDLIVLATVSGDYLCPSQACLVQDRLGCRNAGAFDISAACAGFLYALSIGSQFVASGSCRNVLVLGGEALSRISDPYDRNSVVLFGDGAGAALLQPHAQCRQGLIEDWTLGSDGSGYHYIIREKGGGREPMSPEVLSEGTHMLRMKGREVYRFAMAQMEALISWAMQGQDPEELGLIIPHQMNKRILETAAERLRLPPDKVFINIEKLGNTSAASCAIGLAEAWEQGRLQRGKLVVLAAFGAGLVWAGARLRW